MFHISTHPTLWNCAKFTVSLLISWLFWRGPRCDQKAMCKMDYTLIWWLFLIANRCSRLFWSFRKRYDLTWVWINTYRYIFRGMNIHLPAILMFTRGTRFWHTATSVRHCRALPCRMDQDLVVWRVAQHRPSSPRRPMDSETWARIAAKNQRFKDVQNSSNQVWNSCEKIAESIKYCEVFPVSLSQYGILKK